MSLYLDFNSVCFLLIAIVFIVVGYFTVKVLKRLEETVKSINKVIEKSEFELENTVKNVEKITREAGNISEHVTSLAAKAEAAGNVASNVIHAVVKKL